MPDPDSRAAEPSRDGGNSPRSADVNGSAPATAVPPTATAQNSTSQDLKQSGTTMAAPERPELDDFGLPIRKIAPPPRRPEPQIDSVDDKTEQAPTSRKGSPATVGGTVEKETSAEEGKATKAAKSTTGPKHDEEGDNSDEEEFKDAISTPHPEGSSPQIDAEADAEEDEPRTPMPSQGEHIRTPRLNGGEAPSDSAEDKSQTKHGTDESTKNPTDEDQAVSEAKKDRPTIDHSRDTSIASTANGLGLGISEFSHQQLTTQGPTDANEDDGDWQEMPAYAPYDIYDDDNRLVAKEHDETADEKYGYAGLGGAGKGYTRVLLDDDAESATSMDDNTQYLFKNAPGTSAMEDEENQRDAVSQLQATKDLLTEGQRIAYVGVTRLELSAMLKEAEQVVPTKKVKKEIQLATENMKMWSQKMMIRLYSHMDISPAEQVMIEQLADHGVVPNDLTPVLLANSRVKNPMADDAKSASSGGKSPGGASSPSEQFPEEVAEPPPAYEMNDDTELTAPVRTPSQMETSQKIDIDLRWTVLCDLFLVLIADSVYDSRSRVLLERVGKDLEIPWIDICRFEKKVTDALEMQQNAEKENWNEEEHMESRRKLALRRRYVMMGLATVGGGLVIGLSAGLLAPMIGAGLAAGFTTIGVGGTSSFLAGAGGAAIITSGAASAGGIIGGKAANRRTGAVKTFEYRPLHNNKRVNLIVTVSGWMTGKVDDVRLPFSTVDPVMGDIYSVLWEPEMLSSMGDTINILATEALTQGLQQLLGSTILISLMAALQLPVVLTKLAYLIDNPWAVSLDRATMAGLILADSLIDRNLGTRPITLVGYSLGSRVIFSCLQELARKGALGLVQNVYLFGSPMVVKQDEYLRARTVVAGRFVNGFNRNDWILGYLFRLTNGGIRRIAGLAPVDDVAGIENFDVTEHVVGHMDYRTAMPRLLRECGWLVESDEFTEIEDPDPENHGERQRELINEIEEARKELEKEGKATKGGFSFFRKKKSEKQEWELYDDNKGSQNGAGNGGGRTEDKLGNNHGVLFDVDAIRAELAREKENNDGTAGAIPEEEMFQVKEIKSTLPPMKLDLTPATSPRGPLKESKTSDGIPFRASSFESRPAGSRTPSYSTGRVNDSEYYRAAESSHGANADEIQMTFDTSFSSSRGAGAASTNYSGLGAKSNGGGGGPSSLYPGDSPVLTRPDIKTSQTVPNITINDPWADEADDDFGKEKEITMTFA